jgi:hypothetical protein
MQSELNPAIQIRLRGDLWSAVETFRRNEPDIPTRPEAVRRLLHRALRPLLDSHVLALDIAGLFQALTKCAQKAFDLRAR